MGPRLREARVATGFSLRQFASRVGISSSALSQIETGKSAPSVNTLYSIVSELGLSLDQLFATPNAIDRAVVDGARSPAGPGGERVEDTAIDSAPDWDARGARDDAEPPAEATDEWPVQRRECRAILRLDTGVAWERLTADDDPRVDFIVSVYEAGGASAPEGTLVRHGGREFHVVVRGELSVTLGFKRFTLRPGDSISFYSSEPHMLANRGTEPTEVISAVVDRAGSSRASPR